MIWTTATAVALAGCWEKEDDAEATIAPEEHYSFAEDIAQAASDDDAVFVLKEAQALGIDFVNITGADGRKLMPETMGPGCGLVDLTGDGQLEMVFVDGTSWDAAEQTNPMLRVYARRDGAYAEITQALGLAGLNGYGMGLAAADYDADGDTDLAVTGVFGVHLLRNDDGQFTDVSGEAGLSETQGEWSSSAAWVDADGDGWLDLVIANYVQWSVETDIFTTLNGTDKSYATPTVYSGLPNRLYQNDGSGVFTDIAAMAGMDDPENKALGIAVLDLNHDGLLDLFLSNDTTANKAYLADGYGGYMDMALAMGMAFDDQGRAKAGMGVDAANIDDGPVVVVGNFSDEALSHFEEIEAEVFAEGAQKRGLGVATRPVLTFGLRFADFNADGRADLLLANGHIEPEISEVQSAVSYEQPIQLYLSGAEGRYHEPESFGSPMVSRCLAVGDIDGDLDQDAVVTVNGGAPVILENQTGNARQILIDLENPDSPNRAGIGAVITLEAGDWSSERVVRPRGSYLAHSPYTIHAALPEGVDGPVTARITWPDGQTQTASGLETARAHVITFAADTPN
ncbi:MAG: CRTAC1 family protein [Mangrovicoccus sp.]